MRNQFWRKALVSVLTLMLLFTSSPAIPAALAADSPSTLSLANGIIEVVVSTKNGGFLVRTLEGDVISKDDNNRELLYHNDRYDTCFTSFQVTAGAVTKEYIFGSDYSFLGLGNNLQVSRSDTGIKAVWSADNLTFTQLLEPVASESSNEHGTIRISYSVRNQRGEPVAVKARVLLDTALGKQDHAYYELAKSNQDQGGVHRVEQERIFNRAAEFIPANFFAYDDYVNPTIAAYTIFDPADGALQPYQLAFGHWNNLAATVFDFTPNGGLTFTNAQNRQYLTADSAFALYFDLQAVTPGQESKTAAAYYGIDSKVRVKDRDRVGISVTAPLSLSLNASKTHYLDPADQSRADGHFSITTNITNLPKPGAAKLEEIAVQVLVDEGISPLDSGGNFPNPLPNNKQPYTVKLSGLDVAGVRQLQWDFTADIAQETTYRKIVFRAFDLAQSPTGLPVREALIGESTTYLLCPGGNGAPPSITFTSSEPGIIYNQGTRHLYLTGTGFNLLEGGKHNYELRAYSSADRSRYFVVPPTSITQSEPGVLDVVLTETMPTGEYELVFEWQTPPAGIAASLTAPALRFLVTTDPAYRNDYYGLVAVVKEQPTAGNFRYAIKTYATEKKFAERTDSVEVLLVFRGEFTVKDKVGGEIISCAAVSTTDTDNITLNGALDFCKGNVQIYRGGKLPGSTDYLMVEFNGDLYTSNSRTAVWSGHAALTPLNDGQDFGLIAYDQDGERIAGKQPQNLISLVWPTGFNMLQTIGGMAVDLRYGQFGAMYQDASLAVCDGYVVSFGGKLDLSFLMPGGPKQTEQLDRQQQNQNEADSITQGLGGSVGGALYEAINGYSPTDQAKAEAEKEKVKPVGRLTIADVLFGKDEGYIGFNSSMELTLPKYVEALPSMGGKLDINTINGYAIGVAGQVKTAVFEMEFELKVRSAPNSGIPVPDKLYFYIAGFEPGINIDGVGAFWLTGGGGGIDKLYDTIFSKGGVPPLTILLSASFDIIKVMSGRADLSLSLRGFQLKLSDIKLKKTEIVVMKGGQLAVNWVPEFDLVIAAGVELYKVIEGGAYLVVDGSFLEFFLRANVKVPDFVPIISGITVGGVDFGGNNDKIWGVLNALGIKLGITYHWGGEIKFGTGANTAKPTYPELLTMGYNPDTGKTLYMQVGSNLSLAAKPTLTTGHVLRASAAAKPTISSNLERTGHRLNLGPDTGSDAALTIRFSGDSRPKTVTEARNAVTFQRPASGGLYQLHFYDSADGADNSQANANLIVDDAANTTTVAVTITDYLVGDWVINTDQAADIVLYNIAPLPEVTALTAAKSAGGQLDLTWAGQLLDQTKISVYLTPDIGVAGTDEGGEMGTLVGTIGGTDAAGNPKTPPTASGQHCSFALPADLQSGDYYVRLIASQPDYVNQVVVANGTDGNPFVLQHVNPEQPTTPGGITLQNSGNGKFRVQIGQPSSGCDGYSVSIYEDTAAGLVPTDYVGLVFEKDASGDLPEMLIGGSFMTTTGQSYGLTPGKRYLAEVAACRIKGGSTPDDKSDDLIIFSGAACSAAVELKAATPPVISFLPPTGSIQTVPKTLPTGEVVQVPTFTQRNVSFTLQSNVLVSGYWSIDGALAQDLMDQAGTGLHQVADATAVSIQQTLCDGEHTLTFSGQDAEGDSFLFTQLFAVDTTPPRLMLTSPQNGSRFAEDGKLWIEGLGEKDARYTVVADGIALVTERSLTSLGVTPDPVTGVFRLPVAVDPGQSTRQLMIMAKDAVGNTAVHQARVYNAGLANIKEVGVLVNGLSYPGKNIPVLASGKTEVHMQLAATTNDNNQFVLNDPTLVQWMATARVGSAAVDEEGQLTLTAGSIGFVEGALWVASAYSLTDALTFGAEVYAGGQHHLVLAASIGGTVKGAAGAYLEGAKVPITAQPAAGYRFAGWTSSAGGGFGDAAAAATVFTMPDADTVVSAKFEHISSQTDEDQGEPSKPNDPIQPPGSAGGYELAAGALASLPLPESMLASPNNVVAYYLVGDRKVIIAQSCVIDGQLVFRAPTTGTYYLEQVRSGFRDTATHWARGPIEFMAARGLFGDMGGGQFVPNGSMTRAMFATVLARLDGADLAQFAQSEFSDVPADSWYSQAVAWAVDLGVTHGVGNSRFGPSQAITREEMATMLTNYLRARGFTLPIVVENPAPFADRDRIRPWAQAAMALMQQNGILGGRPGNLADPSSLATRAECAAIFQRLIRALLSRQAD